MIAKCVFLLKINKVKNFVKKMKGEEVVIEEKEPSRELKILEKRMAKNKLKKENEELKAELAKLK